MLWRSLTPLRSSYLMTNLTILMDLALVREITIVLPLLGLVLLVPNQEYRVLLVLLIQYSFSSSAFIVGQVTIVTIVVVEPYSSGSSSSSNSYIVSLSSSIAISRSEALLNIISRDYITLFLVSIQTQYIQPLLPL